MRNRAPVNITIVLLAMIAAFLGLRLYSVLGKRTGHEQEPVLRRPEEHPRAAAQSPQGDVIEGRVVDAVGVPDTVYHPAAETGIRKILNADRSFDVGKFLGGAQAAYRMVLEAFWAGDRDTLRDLCDDDVYAAFDGAITAREAAGETLDNRLVAIEEATIVGASLNGSIADVVVRFDADISAVTRDAESQVIAGSLSDGVQTHDIWTFTRDLASNDPNWVLDETDVA
jgi:predicted lipid-binding transport protein (Tim44 family)